MAPRLRGISGETGWSAAAGIIGVVQFATWVPKNHVLQKPRLRRFDEFSCTVLPTQSWEAYLCLNFHHKLKAMEKLRIFILPFGIGSTHMKLNEWVPGLLINQLQKFLWWWWVINSSLVPSTSSSIIQCGKLINHTSGSPKNSDVPQITVR